MTNNDNLNQILIVLSPIVFLVLFVAWLFLTIVLEYHWHNFGITKNDTKKAKDWYYGASIALFLVMVVSLIATLFQKTS